MLPFYLVVALVGGFIGQKFKIPAGTMIGAMIAVIAFKLLLKSDWAMPKQVNFFIQVILGLMVGASFQTSLLPVFQKLLIPVILSCIVLVGTGVITSIIFTKTGLLDIKTSYLGTSPGAMSALIIMAVDNQVNTALVTCFHIFRVIFVILTAPLILKFISWIK